MAHLATAHTRTIAPRPAEHTTIMAVPCYGDVDGVAWCPTRVQHIWSADDRPPPAPPSMLHVDDDAHLLVHADGRTPPSLLPSSDGLDDHGPHRPRTPMPSVRSAHCALCEEQVDEWVRPSLDEFKGAVPALANLEDLTLVKAVVDHALLTGVTPSGARKEVLLVRAPSTLHVFGVLSHGRRYQPPI
jgi:hypothetical protein